MQLKIFSLKNIALKYMLKKHSKILGRKKAYKNSNKVLESPLIK
jgi:hypothetical protein